MCQKSIYLLAAIGSEMKWKTNAVLEINSVNSKYIMSSFPSRFPNVMGNYRHVSTGVGSRWTDKHSTVLEVLLSEHRCHNFFC